MKKLIFTACLALLLTGCTGKTKETTKESKAPVSEVSEKDWRDDYNSHIFYHCKNASGDDDLKDIARVLEKRYSLICGSSEHQMSIDYEKKMVALWFNNDGSGEEFSEISPLENRLKFIKGNDESGEVILTNDHIVSCHNVQYSDSDIWYLELEFDEEGTDILKDITTESAGAEEYLTIWLNGNYISKFVMGEPVADGKIQISNSNFTKEYSEKLALKISMPPLPFDILMDEYTIQTIIQ